MNDKKNRKLNPEEDLKKQMDSDCDGLSDWEEEQLGTDPCSYDTDQDGVGDYQEVRIYGTDPLNPDTDGDRVSDGNEIKRGTNPRGKGLLKDLFIPYLGNNYQPLALKPKRLFFYGLSAFFIKFLVIAIVSIFPLTALLTPEVLQEQSAQIFDLTNNLRTSIGLNDLNENQKLNQSAYQKIQDMIINDYFAHASPDGKRLAHWLNVSAYNYKTAGENLAIGFSDAEKTMQAWQNSPTHYQNLVDPDFKEIGVSTVHGNYKERGVIFSVQHFGAPKSEPVILEEEIDAPESELLESTDEVSEIEDRAPEVEKEMEEEKIMENKAEEEEVAGDVLESENQNEFNSEQEELKESDLEEDSGTENNLVLAEKENDLEDLSPEKALIFVQESDFKKEKVIKVVAQLDEEVVSAQVNLGGSVLAMQKQNAQKNIWEANSFLNKDQQKSIFNPLIPASITTFNKSAQQNSFNVDWQDIEPQSLNFVEEYLFFRNFNFDRNLNSLFNISFIYYNILLIIAIIAFLLNIFINIKKQNLSVILSSLGFICFILLLISF